MIELLDKLSRWDVELALDVATRMVAVAVLISALETFVDYRHWQRGGLLFWPIARFAAGSSKVRVGRWWLTALDNVNESGYRFLQLGIIVGAIVLIFSPTLTPVILLLFVLHVFCMKRHSLSNDGSDDMTSVVLVAVLLGQLGGSQYSREFAVWFIAAEVSLSYFTSGVSKLQSATWRRGDALLMIVRTRIFGTSWVANVFERAPLLARLGCLLVVGWEFAFVLALVVPPPVMIAMLAVGIGFHVGCAVAMGLNTFVWAFGACYPSVVVANSMISDALGARLTAVLAVVVALALAVLAALVRPAAAAPVRAGRGAPAISS